MLQLRSNRGSSLLYVIAALIVTGFVGTAMLRMNTSNKISNVHYSTSASARSAAKSGLIYAIQQFESPGQAAIDNISLINKWVKAEGGGPLTDADRWYVGTAANYFSLPDTDFKAKVEILAFDKERRNITLRSEGLGKGSARATLTGVYFLDGLVEAAVSSPNLELENALYLGSGADEVNTPLIVDGATFLNGAGTFNVGGHTFSNGEFRRRTNDPTQNILLNNCTFYGPAYFIDGEVTFETERSTFNDGIGGGATFNLIGSGHITVTSRGGYFNGPFRYTSGTWNGSCRFAGTELIGVAPNTKYGAGAGAGLATMYSSPFIPLGTAPTNDPGSLLTSPMTNIPDLLGIPVNDPPSPTIDLSAIRAHPGIIHYSPGDTLPKISARRNLTGSDMNLLYSQNSDRYYTDLNGENWLIINMRNGDGSAPFNPNGTGFSERVIILVEETDLAVNSEFYESSASGVTFLYVGNNRQITGLGGCTLFRGMVYSNSTGVAVNNNLSILMRSDPAMQVQGSIYSVGTGRYRMEGGSPLTIRYNQSVMDVIAGLGILDDGNSGTAVVTIEGQPVFQLQAGWPNPISTMISHSF